MNVYSPIIPMATNFQRLPLSVVQVSRSTRSFLSRWTSAFGGRGVDRSRHRCGMSAFRHLKVNILDDLHEEIEISFSSLTQDCQAKPRAAYAVLRKGPAQKISKR